MFVGIDKINNVLYYIFELNRQSGWFGENKENSQLETRPPKGQNLKGFNHEQNEVDASGFGFGSRFDEREPYVVPQP